MNSWRTGHATSRGIQRTAENLRSEAFLVSLGAGSDSPFRERKTNLNASAATYLSTISVRPSTTHLTVDATTNSLNWFEIPVKDLARATKFYENVFGLKLTIMERLRGLPERRTRSKNATWQRGQCRWCSRHAKDQHRPEGLHGILHRHRRQPRSDAFEQVGRSGPGYAFSSREIRRRGSVCLVETPCSSSSHRREGTRGRWVHPRATASTTRQSVRYPASRGVLPTASPASPSATLTGSVR